MTNNKFCSARLINMKGKWHVKISSVKRKALKNSRRSVILYIENCFEISMKRAYNSPETSFCVFSLQTKISRHLLVILLIFGKTRLQVEHLSYPKFSAVEKISASYKPKQVLSKRREKLFFHILVISRFPTSVLFLASIDWCFAPINHAHNCF